VRFVALDTLPFEGVSSDKLELKVTTVGKLLKHMEAQGGLIDVGIIHHNVERSGDVYTLKQHTTCTFECKIKNKKSQDNSKLKKD